MAHGHFGLGDELLKDVCELIARKTVRPRIRPARLIGSTCLPAGAFLTIRAFLHDAGEPVEQIAPSTPLAPFTRRHAHLFLGPISRLAPDSLPPVRIHTPIYDAAMSVFIVGLLCLLVGSCIQQQLAIAGGIVAAVSYAILWYVANRVLPASVEFGELKTFRDLAIVVARGNAVAV
jgi:hypothetical protein